MSSLMHYGTNRYVDNINLPVCALSVDGSIVPLVLNSGNHKTADICSPYAHYILYTIDEFGKRHRKIPRTALTFLSSPLGSVLRWANLDRVAFVNNCLFSTNPTPQWSAAQIRELTRRVIHEFPDYAVVLRSANPTLDGGFCQALADSGYRLVRARRVYVLDATNPDCLRHNNTQSDLKLLERSGYRVLNDPVLLERHTTRMRDLYRSLYVSKHSALNCQYTEEFFRLTLGQGVFSYRALEREGRIDGFVSYFVQSGRMTGAITGYDRDVSQASGLYRMLIALAILEASRLRLMLNLSGGAGEFKMLRGAVPVEEFDAVYDSHLPSQRRVVWTALLNAGSIARRVT